MFVQPQFQSTTALNFYKWCQIIPWIWDPLALPTPWQPTINNFFWLKVVNICSPCVDDNVFWTYLMIHNNPKIWWFIQTMQWQYDWLLKFGKIQNWTSQGPISKIVLYSKYLVRPSLWSKPFLFVPEVVFWSCQKFFVFSWMFWCKSLNASQCGPQQSFDHNWSSQSKNDGEKQKSYNWFFVQQIFSPTHRYLMEGDTASAT